MKPADQLADFVRQGLEQGHSPAMLREALAGAGWSDSETNSALAAWTARPGLPPVPRPRPYVSAREALLYGLLFISLGMVAWHIVSLGFVLVERLVPDPLDTGGDYWNRAGGRWSMAVLLAFVPVFLLANRAAGRRARDDVDRRSIVRRWFAAITLMLAVLALLGDAVAAIYALLNGDLSLRFAAKVGLVALTALLVLAYYKDELDAG